MIFIKNMDLMKAFYRDDLGLTLLPGKSSEGWLEFDAGGVAVALHAIPAYIAKDIEITNPPTSREGTPIKLVFEVPDIEVARIHLTSHGAVMSEPYLGFLRRRRSRRECIPDCQDVAIAPECPLNQQPTTLN